MKLLKRLIRGGLTLRRTAVALSPVDLPDFRNLGVMLRIAVLVESVGFLVAFAYTVSLTEAYVAFFDRGVLLEPVLLFSLLVLFILSPWLGRLSYRQGVIGVMALVVLVALGCHWGLSWLLPGSFVGSPGRTAFLAAVMAFVVLAYFNWRHHTLSPALLEARLLALQARIRPHFLFNSLNTVLGLVRDDPRRAERVLENLSDLFRALMAESRALVPLAQELDLARAYAEIEVIRLGERLRVNWDCDRAPMDALVPPLLIQPLLENAVYHGVEPLEGGGEVSVRIEGRDDRMDLVMRNPCGGGQAVRSGNRMALDNIRERLDLHFDAEAGISWNQTDDGFEVRVHWPYRRAAGAGGMMAKP